MKTPQQWHDIVMNRGATTEPAGSLRLYRQIQEDALMEAEKICLQNASSGNPEGWTDTVSNDCAELIKIKRTGGTSKLKP